MSSSSNQLELFELTDTNPLVTPARIVNSLKVNRQFLKILQDVNLERMVFSVRAPYAAATEDNYNVQVIEIECYIGAKVKDITLELKQPLLQPLGKGVKVTQDNKVIRENLWIDYSLTRKEIFAFL